MNFFGMNLPGPLGPVPQQRPTEWVNPATVPPVRANEVCMGTNSQTSELVLWFGYLDPMADGMRCSANPAAPMVVEMTGRIAMTKEVAQKLRLMLNEHIA